MLRTPSEIRPERLDKWLARQLPDHSRTRIQQWMREGRILDNGEAVTPNHPLVPDHDIQVHPHSAPLPGPPQAEDIPLNIVFSDEALVVVNKPPGLVVHPAPGHDGGTLVNALLHLYPDLAGVGDPERPGLVHRLDADTSGLLVFARGEAAYSELQRQFRERETRKEYQCLVWGIPSTNEGRIDLPIGRHPVDRKRRAVNGEGARDALSHFRIEEGLARGQAARLTVRIETGRTHQIRVHLAHIGHPILGDHLYANRRQQLSGGWPLAGRQMLHAFRLHLTHPLGKMPLAFEAAPPADFNDYLLALRRPAP